MTNSESKTILVTGAAGFIGSAIVDRLLQVIRDLYNETDGVAEAEGDLQLWYNRGYANGVARALRDLEQG